MPLFAQLKPKLIYVYRINDEAHRDILKIGETSCNRSANYLELQPNCHELNAAAHQRIKQQTQTAGISYELLYTEITAHYRNDCVCSFNDKDVHNLLSRSGIKRKVFDITNNANEWFYCDLATAKSAISALKEGRRSLRSGEITTDRSPIIFRPEQKAAIEKTIKQFKKTGGRQMLWNAKMRFGKTLTSLQIVRLMKYERTLILTHRPVVDQGWFEDFGKIFYDLNSYNYGSKGKGESFTSLDEQFTRNNIHYIYFASMQDLRGSETVGGKFNKNDEIFSTPWDLIIVDEAHEGTQTALGKAVMNELTKNKPKVLRLSGTPFNLLADFREDEIYTWDYVMEQRAKEEWEKTHLGDPNPYAGLPKLNIFTYDLGTLINEFADEDVAFNFREFFRTREDGSFIHEKDIVNFLNFLTVENTESAYPFSNEEYRNIFRHTLWMLPGVKAAKALSALLKVHHVFQHFEIVNVAGEGDKDEENGEALKMVENAIGKDPDETRTITLSCGRLTTGVSVKPWMGVLMLSGSFNTAASAYMQTIFRVQTPATINGRVKENCYVFDFAPDRTLQVLATVPRLSTKAGKTTDHQKQAMREFLNFCPVIAVKGSKMETLNVTRMLQQLKRAYVERVVRNGFEDGCLYNDELIKLSDIEIAKFDDLKRILGQTKAMGNTGQIDINNQGLTNEEYEENEKLEKKRRRELTDEEKQRLKELKEKKKVRDKAISILRGISIRMPLMLYGANVENEDEELTIDNFTNLIDQQSWEEFMPHGVSKKKFNDFKKYYDPEIFSAAAKRIRAMVRAADKLTIEERIERIAGIFATFRNPDKETVLTPWRVVNMHMSECLGGFCFYNEDYSEIIEEPRYIDHGQVTDEVFAPDTHLLEINSKSGLYPLYLAYNIYRRITDKISPQTLEEHQSIWYKVITDNIFVICKTPMAKRITERTLLGFRKGNANMLMPEDLIEKIKNQPKGFIENVRSFVGEDVKINAIVGNPPYQVMDGGNGVSAQAVYNEFVDVSKAMKPDYISMIIPARWYAGGKGLDKFRSAMSNDNRMKLLFDYPNSKSCFTNVDIAGGLCYFLWDKNETSNTCEVHNKMNESESIVSRPLNTYDVFIRDNNAIAIIDKVQAINKGKPDLSTRVSSRKPFKLATNYQPKDKGIPCWFKQEIGLKCADNNDVADENKFLDKWKLLVPPAPIAGQTDFTKPIGFYTDENTRIAKPGECCTESYIIAGAFDSEDEVNSFKSYLFTKVVRFLLLQKVVSQHVTKKAFSFIPDLENYQGVYSDKRLCVMWDITDEEWEHINSRIK